MRRVFRDYIVLLASNQIYSGPILDLLRPLGFKRVETTSKDKKALAIIKKIKPNLVVVSRSLGVFSGVQVLSAAREDPAISSVPFIVVVDKGDTKPGGLAEQIGKIELAGYVAMPSTEEIFSKAVLELLDPLIDPDQEKAYGLFDEAVDAGKAGDLEGAARKFAQGVELYGRNASAWLNYAAVLADIGQYDEAEQGYFRALRLDNMSLMAYFGLADLYERRKDYDQTIGLLKQALDIAHFLKASSNSVSKINFFIGEFELRLKRLSGAEEAFEEAISHNPDDAELRADIGDSYSEKGYWEEAEKHYEASIEIDPNLAHVFNRLGIAYRRQEKYEKALELYDNARLHHPDDENLLFNMARAHYEADRFRDAAVLLEEALLMDPQFNEASWLITKLRSQPLQDVQLPTILDDKEPKAEV